MNKKTKQQKSKFPFLNWKPYQFYSGISTNIQFHQDYYGYNYRLWKVKRDFFPWSVNQQLQQKHPISVVFPKAKLRTIFQHNAAAFSLLKVHNQSSVHISHLRSETSQCSSALKIILLQNRRRWSIQRERPITFPEWFQLDGREQPWKPPTTVNTGSS